MTSTSELRKPRVVTPSEIAIHSHSLLKLYGNATVARNILNWNLNDLKMEAEVLGVQIMYEPLRQAISPARQDIENSPDAEVLLQAIHYLAEPSRGEAKIPDYFSYRLILQLLSAALEQSRFAESSIKSLRRLQQKLLRGRENQTLPVRVYADRQAEGVPNAAILDDHITTKVYALDHDKMFAYARKATMGSKVPGTAADLVKRVREETNKYDVSGIEMSLVALVHSLGDNRDLLELVISEMLQANNPKHPELALVQSIAIEPGRRDLRYNVQTSLLDRAVNIISEHGFGGTIIYTPGGGNIRDEIDSLRKLHRS
ncbi:MAG: hypothetical protein ABI425_02270 [Patescibacteria group bacterium]